MLVFEKIDVFWLLKKTAKYRGKEKEYVENFSLFDQPCLIAFSDWAWLLSNDAKVNPSMVFALAALIKSSFFSKNWNVKLAMNDGWW